MDVRLPEGGHYHKYAPDCEPTTCVMHRFPKRYVSTNTGHNTAHHTKGYGEQQYETYGGDHIVLNTTMTAISMPNVMNMG